MPIDNMLIDRAALERFQEAHPELQSATAIASMPEGAFVEKYAAKLRAASARPGGCIRPPSMWPNEQP